MKKRKTKKTEILFTATERRILQLPQRVPQYGPEARALRNIINTMPWVLDVADMNFDPQVATGYVMAEGIKIQAEGIKKTVHNDYIKRMKEIK